MWTKNAGRQLRLKTDWVQVVRGYRLGMDSLSRLESLHSRIQVCSSAVFWSRPGEELADRSDSVHGVLFLSSHVLKSPVGIGSSHFIGVYVDLLCALPIA